MKTKISAIITAGGNHTRFQRNKMLALLKGKPLILHTLEKFSKVRSIAEIIVLVKEEEIDKYRELISKTKIKVRLVPAKAERIISVYYAALVAKGKYLITHDGCRPLTPVSLIKNLIKEVIKHEAVMTAVNPTATVKRAETDFIEESLPRSKTWIAQTPQAFERNVIIKAFKKAIKEKHFVATDDSELVTRSGKKVKIIPGDEINLKVTFPHDLVIAEQLLTINK